MLNLKTRAVLLGLLLLAHPAASAPTDDPAHSRVRAAIDAMGGEAALRGLQRLRFEARGHKNLLEQSERPEGPWIPSYEVYAELVDFDRGALRTTTENKRWGFTSTTIVADSTAARLSGDRSGPGSRGDVQKAEERVALGPERVLLTALAATDLRGEPDVVLQDVPHHVVAFTWRDAPVRLFLNAHTHLPTAVEYTRANPYDLFLNIWGDVTWRTYYSYWTIEAGGLRYPNQWDVMLNGQPYAVLSISELTVHAPAPADSFAISDEIRAAFAARGTGTFEELTVGRPDRPAAELAPGIVQLPGWWDVALVRQPDGLVVVEAPISSGYSAAVLAEAVQRFPGVPVKAVLTTSDAWPHLAGVREYVARGVPVYALDLNRSILTRLLEAPRTAYPDALERRRRAPEMHVVSGKTVVGEGDNRIELYPVRGEAGERMMVAYLPAHRLLYASDLVQKQRDGSFWQPEYLSEVAAVVEREGLAVERVFAMHMDAIPWSDVLAAIAQAAAPGS